MAVCHFYPIAHCHWLESNRQSNGAEEHRSVRRPDELTADACIGYDARTDLMPKTDPEPRGGPLAY